MVSRIPLLSLKPGDIDVTSKGKNIRDSQLQRLLSEAIESTEKPKDIETALANFAASERLADGRLNPYRGIRRVRMIESLQSSARVEIRVGDDKPYKAYKGDSNHCYEIWRVPNGEPFPWVITTFEAHGNAVSRPHPAAKRLMRLFKRDMVAVEQDGKRLICYVQKFDADRIFLAPHTESNADARNRDKNDDFSLIQMATKSAIKASIRRILVDEIGRVQDPSLPV